MSEQTLKLIIHDVIEDGNDVILLDLRAEDQSDLPEFSAGAHIDICADNGITRQYSLCNASHERHRYLVAVLLASPSRGGSEWIHQYAGKGKTLTVSAPRNHFALQPDAEHSVLIAGGIGVTPVLAMAHELEAQGKSWVLHFSARTKQEAALLRTVHDFAAESQYGKVVYYFTREGDPRIDFAGLFTQTENTGAHFYCCGSNEFLDAYIDAGKVLPAAQVHYERFTSDQETARDNEFTLVLARSNKELEVNEGESILEVLTRNDVRVKYMCSEGVCGSCEVRVLEGTPDHRDSVLSDAEKSANDTMMVCCSGSLSKRLVLDL